MLEMNFMTSMIKADGSFLGFVSRPIAAVLAAMTFATWAWMLWETFRRRKA
jgi:TctA family transporter